MQAVKGDVAKLEQLVARLTERLEAQDRQGLVRSQELADLSHQRLLDLR